MTSSALPIRDQFSTDHLLADIKGRSVRGGAVTLAAQAIKFALQMGSTMVLARLLTPADFGLIAMVVVVTGFVAMFKDAGLSMATVQRAEITHEQVSTLFWINVALSVLIMVVVAALAPVIAWFYDTPELTWITLALACTFIFSGLTVQHQALLQRQMRFRALAVIQILSLVAGSATAITMALRDFGYWSLVGLAAGIAISNAVAVWIICDWRPGLPKRGTGVRPMIAFGGNLTGFNFLNYLGANIDKVLLGWMWGAGILGLYSRAYHLLLLPLSQLNAPLTSVAIPTLSRLQDQPERYRRAYLRMLEKLLLVTMPLTAFVIATSDWLIWLVLGPQWMEAARLFAILGLACLMLPIGNTTGWLFISQGRTRLMLYWGLFDTVLKVLLIVVGLSWGAIGVALAITARSVIVMPALLWVVGRSGPVRAVDIYRTIAMPLGIFVVCIAGILAFRLVLPTITPLIGLPAGLAIVGGLALLCLFVLPAGRLALADSKIALDVILRPRRPV